MFFNERVYGKPAQYIVCSAEAERLFALGVLRGRFVSDSDGKGAMPVAVISEALARDVFGRIDVIGESIDIVQQPSDERGHAPVERRTLIGVAADVHTQSPGKTAIVYVPYEQDSSASLGLIVKARGDVVNAVRSLADAARRSFPGVLVLAQESADSLLGSHLLAVRVAAWVSGVLGTVSLLLAMTGLYGILATQVSQRTRELGIRLALGAAPSQIKSMVVGEGIRPVVEGALIGIVLGNLSRSVVGPALTGKISSTFDVSWTTEVLIGLSLVAVCATIIPASRAAAVEPLVALRDL
jgi:ABC-type antimicrobial peptide transport system permease subunit